ncbi:MAG: cell division protein FtsX [Thermoanaerobaculia bacterium]
MSLFQALRYFFGEALRNLLRGWRISSLAVATTALSLFIGGTLVLLGGNMARAVDTWRAQAQVVVFLDGNIAPADRERLHEYLESLDSFVVAREVSPEEAAERFRSRFPELDEVTEDLERSPLPASIELEVSGDRTRVAGLAAELSHLAGVAEVDDDREWLETMNTAASVASTLGLLIGGILMVAAAVSIASVVRLSTFVYRKEISAMRLIGATEFFVRGPFVIEGLVQGVLGAGFALGALWLGYWGLAAAEVPWFVRGALLEFFLTRSQILALLSLGGLAGLIGGLIPLRERTGVFG